VNGELANVIALALHGSAWLDDPSVNPPELERFNSTFQYVCRIQFDPPSSRWRHADAFASTAEWLAWLQANSASRLWLVVPEVTPGPLEPHLVAGFANSGGWGLLATGQHPTLWMPSWEVSDRNASDNRIWSVRFAGSRVDARTGPNRPQMGPALANLVAALRDVREFALDHSLDFWTDWFGDAIDRAQTDRPEIPYHPDLAPHSLLSVEATRLLAAGARSWVFGGMGSWNDLWLDDPTARDRLQAVTRNLYKRMLIAFVAGTNSEPEARPGT
jgi:hypothetical protein